MSDRTTIQFPKDAARALNAIKARSRFSDAIDVIRAAISAYDELLEAVDGGYTIVVRRRTGEPLLYSPYAPFSYEGLMPADFDDPRNDSKAPRTFVFSREGVDRLEAIQKRSYLTSNADVIRAALASYDELLRVELTGDSIFLQDGGGGEIRYSANKPLRPKIGGGLENRAAASLAQGSSRDDREGTRHNADAFSEQPPR